MADPRNGHQRYEIHHSKVIDDWLRQLHRIARHRGQGKVFRTAFKQIVHALQLNPWKAGEPLYRLPGMRLRVRTIVIAPLAIDFGVSEDHPHVYIKSARLLSRQ
jgi:hypothetical protein